MLDDEPYKMAKQFPEVLALGYDPSCNLSCSTCRKELHFVKGEELDTVNRITEIVKRQYLPVWHIETSMKQKKAGQSLPGFCQTGCYLTLQIGTVLQKTTKRKLC